MAAATRGLTPTDIGAIREQLSAGRKPRIVFTESAGQIAGQQGHVVALTDPAGSDEWIVVQFGRDELPFAPVDLATPTRAAAARPRRPQPRRRRQAGPGRTPGVRTREAPVEADRTSRQARQGRGQVRGTGTAAASHRAGATVRERHGRAEPGVERGRVERVRVERRRQGGQAEGAGVADRHPELRRPGVDGLGQPGSRTLAKPYLIKPTEALRMVALVDVPGVHEAVESIIVAERAEAESRAARLRTELAELESRLAELAGRS